MTATRRPYNSFQLVFAARCECARCDKRSPVVFFTRPPGGGQRDFKNYQVRNQVQEELAKEGWELDPRKDKAFCPICKGIGK